MVWGRGGKRGMLGGRKVVDAGTKAVLGRRCEAASRVVVVWRGLGEREVWCARGEQGRMPSRG